MMLNSNLLKRQQKRLSKILTPSFYSLFVEWKKAKYQRYVCKGGRGSAKSSHIAIILVLTIIALPVNAICFRKVAATLETSVFEQIKWAIKILGVESYFEELKNPYRIIYKERGNKIIFKGLDDSEKTKSVITSDFPLCLYWFEELQEYKENEVEKAIQSILRGKLKEVELKKITGEKIKVQLKYQGFFSYNPPQIKQHWVNKKYSFSSIPENVFVHNSCFLNNPYISNEFLLEAEIAKKTNPITYRNTYLGEPIGQGIIPFPLLILREIKDSEIKTFDNYRNGIDWGYATDPVAWVRWHYDKKKRIAYAVNEFVGVQKSNRELATAIKLKKAASERHICDSSEPKSRDEVRKYGINIRSAKKGKGSVEYGEKWLAETTLVIDPKRTPNIAREFEQIDYETDRWGEPMARLEDKNNHTIDATRYAFEEDMKASRIKRKIPLRKPKGL